MSTEPTIHGLVRRVNWKSNALVMICVVLGAFVLLSTTFLQVRVVQIAGGLNRATHRIAAQQVVLKGQQEQIVVTQTKDAAENCASTNVGFATQRFAARQEAAVQIRQAISLYQRTQATLAVNPPKNVAAQRARVISDTFLRNLVSDTVNLSANAIRAVDAKTVPLSCGKPSSRARARRSP